MNIHTTQKGIILIDGFYLVKNPRTQKINVISINKNTVYIHDVTRQMTLQQLINLDATGYLEIFESLKLDELSKKKDEK